jgi:multidrug transporter EmrE-like cation transporter
VVTPTILYILIVFVGTGGELCVSRAMKTIGEVTDFRPHAIAGVVGRALALKRMWMGITLMAIAFFALLGMLSLAKVSFVFPATASSYAAGALGGRLFLGERVTPQRWLGVLLVCIGVVLVFLGNG